MDEGILKCRKCGSSRDLARGDVRYHIQRGWPVHCGQTMEWFTPTQIERAAAVALPEDGE